MDGDFQRPRYRTAPSRHLMPAYASTSVTTSQYVASSAISVEATTVPTAVSVPSIANDAPKNIDFALGAKAHKKQIYKKSLARGLAISIAVVIAFAGVVAAGGLFVNKKYQNKSLPFSYIGELSIGGLTEAQIKEALDLKVSQMSITFVDGGLKRTVPLSQFAAKVDTAALANQATHTKFSPFSYLNKHRYEASVSLNERLVEGYVAMNINQTKTPSANAKLVIEKNKIKIQPETQGFRTNPQFVIDRIKSQLSNLSVSTVNVNLATIRPTVYATDLEDDLARANGLVNTPIALTYGKTTIKPTADEKMSWIQMNNAPGAEGTINISFNKSLIRQYVITQATKFQSATGANLANVNEAVLTTQKGTVINNIDEATDALALSLTNGSGVNYALNSKIGTYNRLVSSANSQQ